MSSSNHTAYTAATALTDRATESAPFVTEAKSQTLFMNINIRKLQCAGSILARKEKSIAEAAFGSGFSSIGTFYRKFKKQLTS